MYTNQYQLRQAFKAIKYEYAKVGRDPIITPSDIRLEVIIKQNVNYYQFYALQSEQNPNTPNGQTNTEIRINPNDSFWAVLGGMYLAKPASASDAEYVLYSYPNPTKFTAAIAAPFNTFYNNCNMWIAVNNVQYIQNFMSSRFRFTPPTQEGLGATSSTAAPANVPSTSLDMFDGNESGITGLGTLIEMPGQKKIDIKLNVPAGLSVAPAGTERIVLIFRGFLALNAAQR